MANFLKAAVTVAVAAGALLGAKAAHADMGVVFVHGTGDQDVVSARDAYWTSTAAQKMSKDSAGNQRPYLIVGYQGASCDATGIDINYNPCSSWQSIADQVSTWVDQNPHVTDLVIVTHSNGINPVRYLLTHPTQRWTAQRVAGMTRKVVASAGSMGGTPLANKIFNSAGSLTWLGRALHPLLGGYAGPAVRRQQTVWMANANADGTFGNTPNNGGEGFRTHIAGVPLATVVGTKVNAALWSKDAYCAGYLYQAALWALSAVGFISSYSDGFIEVGSATYMGTTVYAQEISHHQNRRDCKGADEAIKAAVSSAPAPYVPGDQFQSGASMACNATTRTIGSGSIQYYGCSGSMSYDYNTDFDCLIAYGKDNGISVAPTASQPSAGYYYSRYKDFSCPDTWRGNNVCDLCIVAKYGVDAKDGLDGATDCDWQQGVNKTCTDIAYDTCASTNFWGSCKGGDRYLSYTAIH